MLHIQDFFTSSRISVSCLDPWRYLLLVFWHKILVMAPFLMSTSVNLACDSFSSARSSWICALLSWICWKIICCWLLFLLSADYCHLQLGPTFPTQSLPLSIVALWFSCRTTGGQSLAMERSKQWSFLTSPGAERIWRPTPALWQLLKLCCSPLISILALIMHWCLRHAWNWANYSVNLISTQIRYFYWQ